MEDNERWSAKVTSTVRSQGLGGWKGQLVDWLVVRLVADVRMVIRREAVR